MNMERKSGILMPVFSLPGKYGIGDFGKESYEFVDFLVSAGQRVWQILPLVQTGYGNSPYSSVSSESFNPYFISLEKLKEQKLLTAGEIAGARSDSRFIDYERVSKVRFGLLRKAFSRFDVQSDGFKNFLEEKRFHDYALFMSMKERFNNSPFCEWASCYKFRDEKALKEFENANKGEMLFWQFLQYEAEKQWHALKKYANDKGVEIMGDLPLYVAKDSVDVWKNPTLFKLDEDLNPTVVAGVPPDYFSETGQLWGNPVYDYDAHKKDGFKWWTERLKKALEIFDYVRIDHFRGLDRYYEVDCKAENAIGGNWVEVPSKELFDSIHKHVNGDRIIAEDLGIIDDGVRALLKYTGYPGMKVLSFAFDGNKDNLYLPENIEENYVCYTGTHDNDTLMGLIESVTEWDYDNIVNGIKRSLKLSKISKKIAGNVSLVSAIVELGFSCRAELFVMPMQDALFMGTEYRINEPGTVKPQNWAVRLDKSHFKPSTAKKLKALTVKYKR